MQGLEAANMAAQAAQQTAASMESRFEELQLSKAGKDEYVSLYSLEVRLAEMLSQTRVIAKVRHRPSTSSAPGQYTAPD